MWVVTVYTFVSILLPPKPSRESSQTIQGLGFAIRYSINTDCPDVLLRQYKLLQRVVERWLVQYYRRDFHADTRRKYNIRWLRTAVLYHQPAISDGWRLSYRVHHSLCNCGTEEQWPAREHRDLLPEVRLQLQEQSTYKLIFVVLPLMFSPSCAMITSTEPTRPRPRVWSGPMLLPTSALIL